MFHRFDACEAAQKLVEAGLPLPAYEQVMKASHTFNLLDARRAISVTERQRYILRVRTLAQAVAKATTPSARSWASGPKIPGVRPSASRAGCEERLMSATMKPLLIELGTEELPVKALPGLAQAFFDGIVEGLRKRGVACRATAPSRCRRRADWPCCCRAWPGTARAAREVLGPYLNIALDAEGQPTKALQGFAAKAGSTGPRWRRPPTTRASVSCTAR
jgi:hypothetical protein